MTTKKLLIALDCHIDTDSPAQIPTHGFARATQCMSPCSRAYKKRKTGPAQILTYGYAHTAQPRFVTLKRE